MPKAVKLSRGKEFQFKATRQSGGNYDWDSWLDGSLIMLEQSQGEKNDGGDVVAVTKKLDYEVRTDKMPYKVKQAALKRYKIAQVSRVDPDGKPLGDAVIIQARDMTPEERQAEDARRVEVKAAWAKSNAARKDRNGDGDEDSDEAE